MPNKDTNERYSPTEVRAIGVEHGEACKKLIAARAWLLTLSEEAREDFFVRMEKEDLEYYGSDEAATTAIDECVDAQETVAKIYINML